MRARAIRAPSRAASRGTVVEGWLSGAQVHEEGQLVDPATLRFVGEIEIMPASA
jgi:hypothetical protein